MNFSTLHIYIHIYLSTYNQPINRPMHLLSLARQLYHSNAALSSTIYTSINRHAISAIYVSICQCAKPIIIINCIAPCRHQHIQPSKWLNRIHTQGQLGICNLFNFFTYHKPSSISVHQFIQFYAHLYNAMPYDTYIRLVPI